jgi:hypothetical protein
MEDPVRALRSGILSHPPRKSLRNINRLSHEPADFAALSNWGDA